MLYNNKQYELCYRKKGYKPLVYVRDKVLVHKRGRLYLFDVETLRYEFIVDLPIKAIFKYLGYSRLAARLLRIEPRIGTSVNDEEVIIGIKNSLYKLNILEKTINIEHNVESGRSIPLNITLIEGVENFSEMICYGEYFSNPTNEKVNIVGKIKGKTNWERLCTFPPGKIKHIHNIVVDKFRNMVWILSGDFEEGTGIWYTQDNFKTVKPLLIGSQQYRCCNLFPNQEGFIYITDTQEEKNSIYEVHLEPDEVKVRSIDKKLEIEGSNIYGSTVGGNIVFSTTVEPKEIKGRRYFITYKRGKGIKSWNSHLMIGNQKEGFKVIGKYRKDIWPMGLFQFGLITFPSGASTDGKIVCYGNSLKSIDGNLLMYKRKERQDESITY